MTTRTGEYNRRATAYRQVAGTTANADGQVPEAAEILARRWAKRRAVSGGERFQSRSRQLKADTTYLVSMRFDNWTKSITPQMWLRFNDEVRLNILRAYDPDDRQREILIECNERKGDD